MGWINQAKADVAGGAARKALSEGRLVYVHRLKIAATQAGLSAPLTGWAEQIEAIEATGWRLDEMSVSGDSGVFLFRRAPEVSP